MKNYLKYVCFAVLAVAMMAVYPREGKFQYDYQVGHPWVYETLISPIDFPLLKQESEILQEMEDKASEVVDYYVFDESKGSEMVKKFNSVAVEAGIDAGVIKECLQWLSEVYDNGIVSDFGKQDISEKVIFVKRDRRVEEIPAQEVYDLSSVYDRLLFHLEDEFPGYGIDTLLERVGVRDFIAPNLRFDEKTTQLVHREAVNYISPTKGMIYSGQLIVTKGEIVTPDICQMLDSYKQEYRQTFGIYGSSLSIFFERLIMVLSMIFLLFVTLFFVDIRILDKPRELLFFLLLVFLSFLATSLLQNINPRLLYLFPFAVFITFASAFFKQNVVGPIYVISLLPLLLFSDMGVELFMINLVAGEVALISFSRFNRGWIQFVNAFVIFVTMSIVRIAFKLVSGELTWLLAFNRDLVFLAVNAVLVIVLYPVVFLFEKGFSLVSYARLRDLADTNNRLLQDLQRKAPGTFQHSMQVANLAENAARRIGANTMLIRVGALYHDIGKLENPMCFVENQTSNFDYHKNLTSEESARTIIRHVDDGMALAKKAGLPEIVSDFILTHHGTTVVRYFYNVYCNTGGDPDNTEPFKYHGKCPQTKEQVILMMADSIEAASRTLKNYTPENISDLVDRILEGKITAEQCAGADISLKEIDIVKESFKVYIQQIYHSRIVYPSRKKSPSKS